ncbi:MAG: hypothetical protein MHPSP_003257, partial [Paramarteilia canceri]
MTDKMKSKITELSLAHMNPCQVDKIERKNAEKTIERIIESDIKPNHSYGIKKAKIDFVLYRQERLKTPAYHISQCSKYFLTERMSLTSNYLLEKNYFKLERKALISDIILQHTLIQKLIKLWDSING